MKGYAGAVSCILGVFLCCTAAAQTGGEHCVQAQQIIAGTELQAAVEIHSDYQSFVESKALDRPLTVQSYASNPLPEENGMTRVLSCKMKTAERINSAYPVAAGATPIASGDSSCEAVHRQWLEELAGSIPAGELALSPTDLVIDEEDLTFMGPMWLRPWPFDPVYRAESGDLHIRTRALYVPFSWWIPMPDRFKGTYYCHLIAPWYLESLLRGVSKTGVSGSASEVYRKD